MARRSVWKARVGRVLVVAAAGWSPGALAAAPDYTEMSLDQLMDVEVTSVSRRPQAVGEAAAAVFVLTREDIRRAGVANVPDALRLVPGTSVARVNASTWAISIRGFNSRFANKLLVLIDGRSVYTPLFSGVLWHRNDLLLEDVERIEVIRGPAPVVWGANAVNGVINIITRDSADTQGTFGQATAGNVESGIARVRHGDTVGDTSFRVFAKGRRRAAGQTPAGIDGDDAWRSGLVGVRSDTVLGADRLRLQGQVQQSELNERSTQPTLAPPFARAQEVESDDLGAHLTGRWSRDLGADSDLSVQASLEYRDFENRNLRQRQTRFDLHGQHGFAPWAGHQVVWGGGYRLIDDELDGGFQIRFDPPERTRQRFTGFVQDTVALVPERLDLVLGTRLEHNDITGFELQPDARLLWRVTPDHSVWTSVSRAVRTPSRTDADVRLTAGVLPPGVVPGPGGVPAVVSVQGRDSVDAEEVTSVQAGYRATPADWLSLDATGFYNDYDQLVTVAQAPARFEPAPPRLVVPFVTDNAMTAQSYGVELAARARIRPGWRVSGSYSFLELEAEAPPRIDPAIARAVEGSSPEQQAVLRSSVDIGRDVQWDTTLRYVDRLPTFDVDSYAALDLAVSWQPTFGLELALVGRNLLDPTKPEFGSEGIFSTRPTEAERSVYFTVSAKF